MSKLSSKAKSTFSGAVSGLGGGAAGMVGGAALGALNGKLTPSSSSNIFIDGEQVAGAKNSKGSVSTNYNMNVDEKALMDYTRKNMLSGLENINVFSPDVRNSIQEQVGAYTRQGLKTINDTYEPMFRNLQSNIAQRFGNLDNSVFMDNLNSIEKNRTNALENLTENILAKQSELYQQELDNRYKYLNQVSGINQNLYNNMFKMLNIALSGLN